MTAKLLVLYPKPLDPEAFEKQYHGQHMPLMRELVGPDVPLPTFKVLTPGGREQPFYRVAEIHFPDKDSLFAYLRQQDKIKRGQESSMAVSTGGHPIYLLCEQD